MSHMIVQHGEISHMSKDSSSNRSSRHNKDDITNVTKVAARKSILMQITRAKAVNTFR